MSASLKLPCHIGRPGDHITFCKHDTALIGVEAQTSERRTYTVLSRHTALRAAVAMIEFALEDETTLAQIRMLLNGAS